MILAHYPGHAMAALVCVSLGAAFVLAYRAPAWRRLPGRRWVLPVLQCVPLGLLLYLLCNPSAAIVREEESPNTVLAIFDTSESMSVADATTENRLEHAAGLAQELFGGGAGGARLATFGFDTTTHEAANPAALARWGGQTNLRPVVELLARHADAPQGAAGRVTGAMVFTDGQASDKTLGNLPKVGRDGFEVVIVGMGAASQGGDVVVEALEAPERVLVDAEYSVRVKVAGTAPESAVRLELMQGGVTVGMRELKPAEVAAGATAEFTVAAPTLGLHRVEAVLTAAPGDTNPGNNRAAVTVEALEEKPLRVLLYSQWALPDMGKLRQALSRDDKVSLEYVLDAFIPEGGIELRTRAGKFPADYEALLAFDALVLGPCDPRGFSRQQIEGLYRFVAERGGGVLLLPGVEGHDLGAAVNEQLKALLPGRLTPAPHAPGQEKTTLQFTAASTAFALPSAEAAEGLPGGVQPFYAVEPKPAASVAATIDDQPVLVLHRVGRGQVCLVNMRPLHLLYRENLYGGQLRTLLSNMIATLGTAPAEEARVQVFAARAEDNPHRALVTAQVLDAGYQPVAGATVLLTTGEDVLRMEDAGGGQYEALAPAQGQNTLVVHVEAAKDGVLMGERDTTLRLARHRSELDEVGLDRVYLQQFAEAIGGRYVDADAVGPELAAAFPGVSTHEEVMDVRSVWRT
jgi:hypothetical protein